MVGGQVIIKQSCRTDGIRQRRRGSAAIEFAVLALPFFGFLLAILEIGVIFLVDSLLETSSSNVSRLVRTGQAQMQELSPEDVKARLCSNMSFVASHCMTRAHVDIRTIDSFTTPLVPDPLKDGQFDPTVLTYQPGQPGDYVLVRIWYEHPVVTPFLADALTRSSDRKTMLATALAFRNEPYL